MIQVLPSTFQYLDKHYPVLDDRRMSTAFFRHATIPLTICADIIIGIAHLIFLTLKWELSETLFWEITHQQLFEYPFQQCIHFFFTSIGTAMAQNYAQGYALGQWAVLHFSDKAYHGRGVIFERMIVPHEIPQLFPHLPLNDENHRHLNRFVEHTIRFQSYQKEISAPSPIKNGAPLYRLFYEKPPYAIHDLGSIYAERAQSLGCHEKDALQEAKNALEAFFALPLVVRVHLLRPTTL